MSTSCALLRADQTHRSVALSLCPSVRLTLARPTLRCGTNLDLKKMYTALFRLRAWYQVSIVFTLQQIICTFGVYMISRIETIEDIALVSIGLSVEVLWLATAGLAVARQDRRFFRRFALFGMVEPSYLLGLSAWVFTYEQCNRKDTCISTSMGSCTYEAWMCPKYEVRLKYDDVWELPFYMYAILCSCVRAFFILGPLRECSRNVFGMGAKYQGTSEVWRVPTDLQPLIAEHSGAKKALAMMVQGANVHMEVSEGGASSTEGEHGEQDDQIVDHESSGKVTGGQRAFLASCCHQLVVGLETAVLIFKLIYHEWAKRLPSWMPCARKTGRKLRKQRSVSGARHVQMCVDLSTMRWSWQDYILIHEILKRPEECVLDEERTSRRGGGSMIGRGIARRRKPVERKGIELEYRSPNGSRMRLRMIFTDHEQWHAWLIGLQVLYAVNLVEDPSKIHFLQSVFRMAPTDNPGLCDAEHLPALMRYLNVDLTKKQVDDEMRHAAKRENAGHKFTGKQRNQSMKRHLHFREFLHLVQRLSLAPAVEQLLLLGGDLIGDAAQVNVHPSQCIHSTSEFHSGRFSIASVLGSRVSRYSRRGSSIFLDNKRGSSIRRPTYDACTQEEQKAAMATENAARAAAASQQAVDRELSCSCNLEAATRSRLVRVGSKDLDEPSTTDDIPDEASASYYHRRRSSTRSSGSRSSASRSSRASSCLAEYDGVFSTGGAGAAAVAIKVLSRQMQGPVHTPAKPPPPAQPPPPPPSPPEAEPSHSSHKSPRPKSPHKEHSKRGKHVLIKSSGPVTAEASDPRVTRAAKHAQHAHAKHGHAPLASLTSLSSMKALVQSRGSRGSKRRSLARRSVGVTADEEPTISLMQMRGLWQHDQMQGPDDELPGDMEMQFAELATKERLDAAGLQRLLLSPENELFDPAQREVNLQDGYMSHPLTDYFIATSHNSYLTGDQFRSNSDVRMYECQLQMGCRCLEIDCWDGVDGEPDVKHGRTMTSAVKFKDVIESINKYAFVSSPYPVILSLEMHCSLPQQDKIAVYLRTILKDKLHIKPERKSGAPTPCLPSPTDLKYKILIKGRALQFGTGALDADDDDDDDDDDANQDMPSNADVAVGGKDRRSTTQCSGCGALDRRISTGFSVRDSSVSISTESERGSIEPSRGTNSTSDSTEETEREGRMRVNARSNRQSIAFRSLGVNDERLRSQSYSASAGAGASAAVGGGGGKKPTARALSDVTACFAKKFPSFWRPGKYTFDAWAMSSYKEGLSQKLVDANRHAEWATHNTAHLSRVYPRGRRLDSSNYNPAPFWQAGVQMTALNYQTHDLGMILNAAMFDANGGCGYVLKPAYLRAVWAGGGGGGGGGGGSGGGGSGGGGLRAASSSYCDNNTDSDSEGSCGAGSAVGGSALSSEMETLLSRPLESPLKSLEMPPTLFRLRIELLAAIHVPTPSDPFLDSHHVDDESFKLARAPKGASPFFWWQETGTEGAAVKFLDTGLGNTKLVGDATACDPVLSVEVHGGLFSGAAPTAGSESGAKSRVVHGSTWESDATHGNGLSARWDADARCFDIIASHPEVTQAVFTVGYRATPGAKATRPLALASINLTCVRTGVRCISMREPKHGLPLRFTKLLLRVSKDYVPLGNLPAATRAHLESVKGEGDLVTRTRGGAPSLTSELALSNRATCDDTAVAESSPIGTEVSKKGSRKGRGTVSASAVTKVFTLGGGRRAANGASTTPKQPTGQRRRFSLFPGGKAPGAPPGVPHARSSLQSDSGSNSCGSFGVADQRGHRFASPPEFYDVSGCRNSIPEIDEDEDANR